MAETRPKVTITEESIQAAPIFSATGRVAYVVHSEKGLYDEFIYVSDEKDLLNKIGEPTDIITSVDFNICKSFLSYGNDLVLQRALDEDVAQFSRLGIDWDYATGETLTNTLNDTGDEKFFINPDGHTMKTGMDLEFYAKEAYDTDDLVIGIAKFETSTGVATWQDFEDTISIGGTATKYSDIFEFGPDPDKKEFCVVVVKDGALVENFIVSTTSGQKNDSGVNEYITDYLKVTSAYINGFSSAEAVYDNITTQTLTLAGGSRGFTTTRLSSTYTETAYSKFSGKNDIEFDYVIDGINSGNRGYIITSIAEARLDCIAFVGPQESNIFSGSGTSAVPLVSVDTIVTNIIADRIALGYSSWSCYFGQWIQKYDKYLDRNIWIPVTGDIAGNKVNTNTQRETWTPAAGTTNGILRNVLKLAFNPSANQQNELYKNGVNHIINKPGKGILVDGQKTMWNKNVGVSRLNIRDLFRVVEVAIGKAAIDFLHEFNDALTRNRFRNVVVPFLDDIVVRRGIVEYELITDESINTPAVIDNYGFRVEVKIKGNRPIEDITIKFFDVPNSVGFDEV